ncbi:ketoacyl-synt-domain-containing protein [Xylariaceae sp. FL1272]|nr:ketoacyl-synt-domain-containing protein [Xylariaceae sp. FL1272]
MNDQRSVFEAIAITGLSFKMPQDATEETALWGTLENGTNVKTKWPTDRATTDAFFNNPKKPNTDMAVFDAPFFSITAKEASSMSPRQRQALEVANHFRAGIPMETLRESRTAVYGAFMADDWSLMASKDAEAVPRMNITGTSPSLLPNKISWFFDLRGPSIHVDTACSSGLTAFDMACQSMLCGDSDAALVLGASTLLTPEASLHLANLNFLSPDGCCYSFDSRGNGYGRGEGVVGVYLKPLRRAVDDGDVIRAIVRATASNQDGKTAVLTKPSILAQSGLIRHTYSKAGLDLSKTRYVEAHGTGTPTGDPIEAEAIARVFKNARSLDEPLFLGSIKANIGHLEGSSGPASVVKAVMMLERGIIPPQALFNTLNPAIDAANNNLKPGLRRVSVNSFGFGGANAHVVLDDAVNYMRTHNIRGFYRYVDHHSPNNSEDLEVAETIMNDHVETSDTGCDTDKLAIQRMLQAYCQYYSTQIAGHPGKLNQLAYTLAARRSRMSWRSYAVLDDSTASQPATGNNQDSIRITPSLLVNKASRVNSDKTHIANIFTGQGAQYANMGLALLRYPVFARSLQISSGIFRHLGGDWSLLDAMKDQNKINSPDFSQPVCTALQIALVDLLRSFDVEPAVVIGHSSGEIAAAYTVAALSHECACKVAYFRGKHVGRLARQLEADGKPGAILSVNLAQDEVPNYIDSFGFDSSNESSVCLACVNSPKNVTLAGPAYLIDMLRTDLDNKGIFAQKLNTVVAYHSPAMETVVEQYGSDIGRLCRGTVRQSAVMVSSVTGEVVEPDRLVKPQYWVENMVSPVQFVKALKSLTTWAADTRTAITKGSVSSITLADLIEIGPHPALRRLVNDTLPLFRYHSCI